MNVEDFDKLPEDEVVYVACDGGPVRVRLLDKHFIASIFNPETIHQRVWLTREAALAAALKLANIKIIRLREVIAGLKMKNSKVG